MSSQDMKLRLPSHLRIILCYNYIMRDEDFKKNLKTYVLWIEVQGNREICGPCVYEKAHKLPYRTRENTTSQGELILTDVC